jgi:excisionase family DNA binding protein
MPTEAETEGMLDKGERLYQPVEIAHILNLKTDTVREYCRDGRIEAKKIGKTWNVTRSEMKRYLKEGPRKPRENR